MSDPWSLAAGVGEERLARIALSRSAEPGSRSVAHQLREQGAAATLVSRCRGRLTEVLEQALADLTAVTALGGRVLVPTDPEWPAGLADLDRGTTDLAAPVVLWVRGEVDLGQACAEAVSVVGSRSPTPLGERTAGQIAAEVAAAGWTVVSGAAFGIDAAAHRGALAAGGTTVAVLAGGADVAYPVAHTALLAAVLASGAVVSESAPGVRPERWRFLARNRIIAALSRGTVLVEAAHRSGALNTVGHAQALDRQVCAVPGPVSSPASVGCHRQLRQGGATLVTCADEVLEDIAPVGRHLAPPPTLVDGVRDALPERQRRLLEALPGRGEVALSALVAVTGVALAALAGDVAALVDLGLVELREGRVGLTRLGRQPSGVPLRR